MMDCTRRIFGCLIGAGCVAALGARVARTQAKARVVVVGGGVGGATAAKYLALSAPELEITLVEPKPRYTTCFFSNLYLAGLRSFASLTHGYEALAQQYAIRVVQDSAVAIDPAAKTVGLESGGRLSYDRLIVAPGIAFKFDAIEGYDDRPCRMPGSRAHRRNCCGINSKPWRTAAYSCSRLPQTRFAVRPDPTSARP